MLDTLEMGEPFIGSEVWLGLVEKPTTFVTFPIIRQLTVSDIQALLAVFSGGSREEQRVAFGIFQTLTRRSKELPEVPWDDSSRSTFIRLLGDHTRLDYATGEASRADSRWPMRMLWAELDPSACVEFLLSLPLTELRADSQKEALNTLAWKAREVPDARDWLEATAARGGSLGDDTKEALEDAGFVSEERLNHWSRLWREEKDPEALTWLYDKWLSYLPVGHPMDGLLSVLGPPDDGKPPDIYYQSAGGHVYVEVYESTGFSGCHRT